MPRLEIASGKAYRLQIRVRVLREHAYVHIISFRIDTLRREDARGCEFIFGQQFFQIKFDFVSPA